MKVLIVGAGPTGLTAAIELARLGVIPKVIDKKPNHSTLSRAAGILPNSLRLLEKSGVSTRLLDHGIKIGTLNVYKNTKLLAAISLQNSHPIYPFVLALAQDETEQILESVFSHFGGQVDYGCKLNKIKNLNDCVSAEFGNGHEETFDYVLGADGVGSRTRQSMGLDFPGFELNETWSIADVDADSWSHSTEFTMCLLGQGRIAVVVPLEKNRYRLVSNTMDVLSDLPLSLGVSNVRRQATFTIAIRQVENYRSGRVYFAGDAAHCHSPVGGRGMNLGIADAAEFAHRLIKNTLFGYSESRHHQGKKAINGSEDFRALITNNNWLTANLVSNGFRLINRLPKLQVMVAKNIVGD